MCSEGSDNDNDSDSGGDFGLDSNQGDDGWGGGSSDNSSDNDNDNDSASGFGGYNDGTDNTSDGFSGTADIEGSEVGGSPGGSYTGAPTGPADPEVSTDNSNADVDYSGYEGYNESEVGGGPGGSQTGGPSTGDDPGVSTDLSNLPPDWSWSLEDALAGFSIGMGIAGATGAIIGGGLTGLDSEPGKVENIEGYTPGQGEDGPGWSDGPSDDTGYENDDGGGGRDDDGDSPWTSVEDEDDEDIEPPVEVPPEGGAPGDIVNNPIEEYLQELSARRENRFGFADTRQFQDDGTPTVFIESAWGAGGAGQLDIDTDDEEVEFMYG